LSRFCARAFPKIVLPDGPCSVHAAGTFASLSPRLCSVKVKLTMRFPGALGLLVWSALQSSPVGSTVSRRGRYTAASNRLVDACGEGWGYHPGPAQTTRQDEGGLSQGPPFAYKYMIYMTLMRFCLTLPLPVRQIPFRSRSAGGYCPFSNH
jgi:hypothetical protein